MTKTTRNLSLLAAFSIIVAGCTTLLNTQANSWADQAEQIARSCPAASQYARQARQAANSMTEAAAAAAQENLEAEATREQLQRELEQAESAARNIRLEEIATRKAIRLLDGTQRSTQDDIANMNWRGEWYQRRANCMSAGGSSANCEPQSDFGGDTWSAGCSTATHCEGDSQEFRMTGRMLQDYDRPALEAMAARDETGTRGQEASIRVDDARLALERFNRSTSIRTQNQQQATDYATTAENAYHEAQRIAAEQCGDGAALQDAPPQPNVPSGAYPQDILNSQSMGLPALPGGPAPLACCSTNAACAICTGGCPAFCSVCNTLC